MATYCVDSAAGGLNDGGENGTAHPDWADAWVSIDSFLSLPPANSDVCLVDDGHSEDLGGNKTYAIVTAAETPYKIHCVDKADDSLSTGAVVDNGGMVNAFWTRIGGSLYCCGVTWRNGHFLLLEAIDNEKQIWENCILEPGRVVAQPLYVGSASSGINNEVHLVECVITETSRIRIYSRCFIRGGSISGGSTNPISCDTVEGVSCELDGVDISAISGTVIFLPSTQTLRMGRMIAKSCEVPANATVVSGAILMSHRYEMHHCESGTPADPSYEMEVMDYWGTTKASAARYRTGGATDKVRSSPYSWEMVATAKALEIYCPHESPPIGGQWTDGDGVTEYTYTIYIASAFTVQDDEFSVELSVPNDDNTSSQAKILTSRLAPQGTPANITADGDSTWNGAGVGTAQKVVFTHTPDKPGPIEARLHLMKASATVYVDPKIYITPVVNANARAYLLPGYGNIYEGDVGAGGLLVHPGMDGGLVG